MIIAVHIGAGRHPGHLDSANTLTIRTALREAALDGLLADLPAAKVVEIAITVLEDAVQSNAGRGSSLNLHGDAQCDAAIIDGDGSIGAVGAVSCTANPITAAEAVRQMRKKGTSPIGVLPPTILVGRGAELFLYTHGAKLNPKFALDNNLATDKTRRQWLRYIKMVEEQAAKSQINKKTDKQTGGDGESMRDASGEHIVDTVGAICVDSRGDIAAGVSSGGNWLKHPGRVGPAAIPGAGVSVSDEVAVCTSGNGEQIVASSLALRLTEDAAQEETNDTDVWRALRAVEGGAIIVKQHNEYKCELLWGHTTPSLAIGYYAPLVMEKPITDISRSAGGASFSSSGVVLNSLRN